MQRNVVWIMKRIDVSEIGVCRRVHAKRIGQDEMAHLFTISEKTTQITICTTKRICQENFNNNKQTNKEK